MILSYNDLRHYAIRVADERTGSVDDIYFDDHSWTVRYLVAHTGFLLAGRQNLVGAGRLGRPDPERSEVPVDLTAEELKAQEPPESHAPVSQQAAQQAEMWPPFLLGTGMIYTPALAHEQIVRAAAAEGETPEPDEQTGDPNLRSTSEVTGYKVSATDGEIGSVSDFLIDPQDWTVQHLTIDTGTWLPGRRVVVTTGWITDVDWPGQRIHVDVTTQAIEDAPPLADLDDLRRSPSQDARERYGALGIWPV